MTTPASPIATKRCLPWLHLLLGSVALLPLAVLDWASRSNFRVLDFLATEGWEGLDALGDPAFWAMYGGADLALLLVLHALAGAGLPLIIDWALRRWQLGLDAAAEAPGLSRRARLKALSLCMLPGLLGLLVLLHLAGFRPPYFTAHANDYPDIWRMLRMGIVASVAGLLAWQVARLHPPRARSDAAPPAAPLPWWRRPSPWLMAAVAVGMLHAGLFTTLTLLRHHTFHSATHDLGLYDQMLWNVMHHGQWRVTTWTFPGEEIGTWENGLERHGYSFLAEHAMPILLFVLPLYALMPGPDLLLILQALALGAAGTLLFLVVRRATAHPPLALAMAAAFVLHPCIHEANLKDFHADAFQPALLFATILAWQHRRLALYLVGALLFVSSKEDGSLMLMAWGAFLMLRRDWAYGTGALLLGMVMFVGLKSLVVEPARDGEPLRHLWRYRHLAFPLWTDEQVLSGAPPAGVGEIIRGFLTNPYSALRPELRLAELGEIYPPILTHERVRALLLVGLPVGFVVVRHWPAWVLLLVPLATALLSNWDHNFRLRMHYGINSTMWMFAAAALVLGHLYGPRHEAANATASTSSDEAASAPPPPPPLADQAPRHAAVLTGWAVYVAVVGLMLAHAFGRAPLMGNFESATYERTVSHAAAHAMLPLIAPEASVSASNNLGPHLTRRRNLMLFPETTWFDHATGQHRPVDVIVVDTMAHPWPLTTNRYRMELHRVLDDGRYGVDPEATRDGIVLLRLGAPTTANAATRDTLRFATP